MDKNVDIHGDRALSCAERKLSSKGDGVDGLCAAAESIPLDAEGVMAKMNGEGMDDECRVDYLCRAMRYWRSRGMGVECLREMMDDCNRALDEELEMRRVAIERKRKRMEMEEMDRELDLEGWVSAQEVEHRKKCNGMRHQIELAGLAAELKRQREMGVAGNLPPMECKECGTEMGGEFTNIHFYLKREEPEVRALVGDMDVSLKEQGYLKSGGGNSIKGALGCINRNEPVRRVVWTGKLVELNALVNYLMDEVHLIGCTSGFNNRWRTTVACFVDKDGREININSLSRSSNISWDDRERLLKCVPRMGR